VLEFLGQPGIVPLQQLLGLGRISAQVQAHYFRCVLVELGVQAARLLVSRQFRHGLAWAVYPFSQCATVVQPDRVGIELFRTVAWAPMISIQFMIASPLC
jgi:hypothetical protein